MAISASYLVDMAPRHDEIFFGVCSVVNYLCGGVPVSSKVHLVLYSLEELLGNGSARIIINAKGLYFQHLAIEHLFRAADVADAS